MVFPQSFLYSMGIAGAIVALTAATLALTVLPTILAVLGPRVNALAPKWLQTAAERDARPSEHGFWYRLSHVVMRRPAPIAIASATLLIALGIPFAHIRFIQAGASVLPSTASARQVETVLNRQFPPNRTSPLQVVVGAPAGSAPVKRLAAQIGRLPDVSAVAPAQPAGPADALIEVAPVHGPQTSQTEQLVRDVRAINAPVSVGIAGESASFVDLEHSLAVHLPVVLAIVVAATLVVLFLFTGSVVLPVKAVIMNFLTLSAMYGILVWTFQDGHLENVLSFRSESALDATQPIFLFAVGFGLATDYGVFLLSRIKEARDAGASNTEAVAVGLERTGRIVTAAALLFAVAIGAFATSQIVFIKELGVGAALAVLIDASIVRALLVPSLMRLLGAANWWAPRPLQRLHDRFGLREGVGQGRDRDLVLGG
jgi:RND superfamily putative drug exporter